MDEKLTFVATMFRGTDGTFDAKKFQVNLQVGLRATPPGRSHIACFCCENLAGFHWDWMPATLLFLASSNSQQRILSMSIAHACALQVPSKPGDTSTDKLMPFGTTTIDVAEHAVHVGEKARPLEISIPMKLRPDRKITVTGSIQVQCSCMACRRCAHAGNAAAKQTRAFLGTVGLQGSLVTRLLHCCLPSSAPVILMLTPNVPLAGQHRPGEDLYRW